VGIFDEDLDHVGVLLTELAEVKSTSEESVVLQRSNKAIELLLLVTLSVLLDDDGAGKVLEEVGTESLHGLRRAASGEAVIDTLASAEGTLVLLEVVQESLGTALRKLLDLSNESIVVRLSEGGDFLAGEVLGVSITLGLEILELIARE